VANDNKDTLLKHSKRKLFMDKQSNGHFGANGYYTSDDENVEIIEATFENKLHQSRNETKEFYSILKNELMSYGCLNEIGRMYEVFRLYELCIARLAIYCGRVRLTLEFNKKKSIKKLRKKVDKLDNILISSGYIELYVDTTSKCDHAIELISILMKDIEVSKIDSFTETNYVEKYETIENVRFAFEEDVDAAVPEMVVVGEKPKSLPQVWFLILIITILLFLLGFTTCTIYKTKKEQKYPTFNIVDKEGNVFLDSWTFNANIDIFNDPKYGGEKIIYPGRSNTYYFYVSNTNDYILTCNITFSADNKDNINMLYRLRVADASFENAPWCDIKDINLTNFTIDKNSKVLCALDWKWEDSDRDTLIGETGLATYAIHIQFSDFSKKS